MGRESSRKRVPHQHNIPDLPHVGESGTTVASPRERSVTDEARGPGIAHEQWRHNQVKFIGEVRSQELGVHGRPSLDHQLANATIRQVSDELAHLDFGAEADNQR